MAPGMSADPATEVGVGPASDIDGRTVLITGGTGSFGSTMARRLLATDVAEVRLFSRDEGKHDRLRRRFRDHRIRFYLGDVRDYDSVERASRGVDYVFHAAALKQVPSCEFFPLEAVRTNVLGSANVIEAAYACGVRTVICLSTDKAVYPINAMGMTKALMEKVAQASARNTGSGGTTVATVRYGNVMYSRGSVIPHFVAQVQAGHLLTVTDPAMTRFLMTMDEAVGLVEYAFVAAQPGDIFVRKAPASTVGDLAQAVCEVFGGAAGVEVIGTRHGEKLFETLVSREELVRAEDCGPFFRVPLDGRGLDYDVYVEVGSPRESGVADYTSHNTQRLGVEEVKKLLLTLPEIQSELTGAGERWGQALVP